MVLIFVPRAEKRLDSSKFHPWRHGVPQHVFNLIAEVSNEIGAFLSRMSTSVILMRQKCPVRRNPQVVVLTFTLSRYNRQMAVEYL